jgi:hypothetical protein
MGIAGIRSNRRRTRCPRRSLLSAENVAPYLPLSKYRRYIHLLGCVGCRRFAQCHLPLLRLCRSEDPKAQALDYPFRGGPIDLGPVRGRIATVFRCLGQPYRTDRVCHCHSFVSSYSTRGKSAPFQVGSLHRPGWPYPSYYWRAFASSHILYPLGIGQLCSRLSPWPDRPWGFPCSASRRCRRRRVTLSPGGGLSWRWADYRPAHPLHVPFGQSLSAALALLTSRGLRVFTMLPIASFLSPALRVRLPETRTFWRAAHPSVPRDA